MRSVHRFIRALDPRAAVFIDVDSLRGGSRWAEQLGAAIARCDTFVVVWSASARDSTWVPAEISTALSSIASNPNLRVLPITIDGTPLPADLASYESTGLPALSPLLPDKLELALVLFIGLLPALCSAIGYRAQQSRIWVYPRGWNDGARQERFTTVRVGELSFVLLRAYGESLIARPIGAGCTYNKTHVLSAKDAIFIRVDEPLGRLHLCEGESVCE